MNSIIFLKRLENQTLAIYKKFWRIELGNEWIELSYIRIY